MRKPYLGPANVRVGSVNRYGNLRGFVQRSPESFPDPQKIVGKSVEIIFALLTMPSVLKILYVARL